MGPIDTKINIIYIVFLFKMYETEITLQLEAGHRF